MHAEIVAETDEQHRERDRDHVQEPIVAVANANVQTRPIDERDRVRGREPPAAQAEDQDARDQHEREQRPTSAVPRRDGVELLRRERELARHAHAHAGVAVEPEPARDLVDARDRLLGRDQRGVVDDRLRDHHAPRRSPRPCLAEQDLPPRHGWLRSSGALGVDERARPVEDGRRFTTVRVAPAQRVDPPSQQREQPAQARVARSSARYGCTLASWFDELRRARPSIGTRGRSARRTAPRPAPRPRETARCRASSRVAQCERGLARALRRRRVDHHQQRIERLREAARATSLPSAGPAAGRLRHHRLHVHVHAEVPRRVEARGAGADRHQDERPPGPAANRIDPRSEPRPICSSMLGPRAIRYPRPGWFHIGSRASPPSGSSSRWLSPRAPTPFPRRR